MSQKELQRMKVVENAVSGGLKVAEAAEMLQLSERQVTRLKGRVTGEAVDWVYHGNRWQSPSNAISDVALGKYDGFNDSHLQEKLTAAEGIALSRQSVRRILRAAQISSPQKRRAPKYRSRRDRREQEGMMVQTDASRHDWLEGRRPMPTILGWIEAHLQAVFAPRARVAADPDIEALFVWCRIEQVDTVVFDVSHGNDFETLKRECLGYIRRELY